MFCSKFTYSTHSHSLLRSKKQPEVWINEFHYVSQRIVHTLKCTLDHKHKYYNHDHWLTLFCLCFSKDNAGKDENEFVEIGCNSEVDLTGYQIVKYNGKDGKTYDLPVTVSEECSPPDAFPILKVPLQNGNPGGDGIALIDKNGVVVEFISYEGSIEATNGPAVGLTSVDVGVSEGDKSMLGLSLQLVGEGCTRADFSWQEPADSSEGKANVGQNIVCGESSEAKDEL